MKRTYKKPMFAAELFVLNQSIAKDCADNIPKEYLSFNDPTICVWYLDGTETGPTVFIMGKHCEIDGSIMSCYNNPTEESSIFRS